MVRLGDRSDLLDPPNSNLVKICSEHFEEDCRFAEKPIPKNIRYRRFQDCAIFEYTYAWLADEGKPVNTCRAVYVPTDQKKRVWKGSWIYEGSHIQLCVRNPKAILGTWLVPPFQKSASSGNFTEITDDERSLESVLSASQTAITTSGEHLEAGEYPKASERHGSGRFDYSSRGGIHCGPESAEV